MDRLCARILCELESEDLQNLICTNKAWLGVSRDSHLRLSWLCHKVRLHLFASRAPIPVTKFDRAERLFELVARPRLCNDEATVNAVLHSGRANFSRYMARAQFTFFKTAY